LDENVPFSIKKIIKDLGYEALTLKDENQLGIKNGEVADDDEKILSAIS